VLLNGTSLAGNGAVTINGGAFTNQGSIAMSGGVTLSVNASVTFADPEALSMQAGDTLQLGGDLLGNTRDVGQWLPNGTLSFASGAHQLEAMSFDFGNVPNGYTQNFAYGTISLAAGAEVTLVDQFTNSAEPPRESVYATSLMVPSGAALNLNGLHLYASLVQIGGTVTGGVVSQTPENGGPLALGTSAPGALSAAGALEHFTFLGRGGEHVVISVDTGSASVPSPSLNYAFVQLLDPSANVVAQASNTVPQQIVGLLDVVLPVDGIYTVAVRAPANYSASTGNYLVAVWDATPTVASLVLNQQEYGDLMSPFSVDEWTFAAGANDQVQFELLNVSSWAMGFTLSGPNGWVGFSNLLASSGLITLPYSGNYLLTAYGTGGAYGIAYAFDLAATPQTNLTVGSSFTGTFAGSGQAQLFQINVPVNQPLLITLTSPTAGNSAAIYAKFGAPPSLGVFDYSSTTPGTANQTILTGGTYPGTWYILVYGNNIPTPASYTITITSAAVIVASCNPVSSGNSAPGTITISGGGFAPNATVALVNGTNAYPASSVSVISASQIQADFDFTAIPPNSYSLQVASGTNSAGVPFTVTGGGSAALVTSLIIPNPIGYHIPSTLYVQYSNTGQVAMPAPLLTVTATQDGRNAALMTLNPSLQGLGYWTTAIPLGFANTVQFLANGAIPGLLQPGESAVVPIYYAGWQQPWDFSYPPIQFILGILQVTNSSVVDWGALQSQMQPASIGNNVWDVLWNNFTSQAGATWGDYVRMLDNDSAYLYRLGDNVSDVGALLAFEFAKANAMNIIQNLASASDAYVPTPGLVLSFSRVFPQGISQRYAQGALGYGWSHNWDFNLSVAADGTVTVTGPGGSSRVFQPDSRGGYFDQAGDHGVLTSFGDGTFSLQETHGLNTVFRSDGKLNYVEDPNGNTISASWSDNRLTSLAHSSGQSLQFTYAGNVIRTVTDQVGRTTTFSYDAMGHLTNVAYFDGSQIAYAYSTANGASSEHALTQITYPSGAHQYFSYDQNGRIASISRDGGGEALSFAYSGGEVDVADAYGNTTTFSLDNNGMLAKIVNAQTNTLQLAYDGNFNLIRFTDPAGRLSAYSYDSMGNLTASTDPLGNQTQFGYTGTFNQLAQLTDANGNPTVYAYNANANLTSITYADSSAEGWAYDAYGNPATWTNRRGNAITYQFNTAGQLAAKSYPDGSQAIYIYDARGNLVAASNSVGLITMTYDGNDRLQRITYPGNHWLEFSYCICGRRETMTDESGFQIGYLYDSAGRLQSLTNTSGPLVQYSYDAAGRIALKTLGNGVYTAYGYDSASQLVALTNAGPGGNTISFFNYAYDTRGRRTSMGTAYGQWTYQYDDLGQLTSAMLISSSTNIASQSLNYSYDALGNRVQAVENGVTTEYTVNDLNQYVQAGNVALNYDADGSLIAKIAAGTMLLGITNDVENRVIGFASINGQRQIEYDALSQPEVVWRNGTQNIQVYDPFGLGDLAAVYSSSGSLVERQFHGSGTIGTLNAASESFLTFDAIGNVADLTSTEGTVSSSEFYQPFGKQLAGGGGAQALLGFGGELGVTQEGDLDYMRARFYDQITGRFSAADPFNIFAGDANIYRYASNAPTMWVDPSGSGLIRKPTLADPLQRWGPPSATFGFLLGCSAGMGPSVGFGLGTVGRYTGFNGPALFSAGCGVSLGFTYGSMQGFFLGWNWPTPIPPTTPGGSNSVPPVNSHDPNSLTGPNGFGIQNYLLEANLFGYEIFFENETNASAPAQIVQITDPLSTNLDWSTFQLSEIDFGGQYITIPPNHQYFQTNIPMSFNGVNFDLQLSAGIHLATGQVFADFYSINPATGLPPAAGVGFLPPEDGTGRGTGHVLYTVRPKPGLPNGTQIANVAYIQFDANAVIATDQVNDDDPSLGISTNKQAIVTIDSAPPSSSVSPLPQTEPALTFQVSWSGADAGPGIASYTIYVSDNGGPRTAWLSGATATNAMFTGQAGDTYGFYSVATDNVGIQEAAHATADATTTIVLTTTLPTVGIGGSVWYYPTNYPATQPSGEGVAGVTLSLTGATNVSQVTATDGSYSFPGIAAGLDYEVTLAKSDDTPAANGVTTLDIALIRRQILGLAPLGSPYKLLAADVSDSGRITTLDIALIRRLILGLTNTFPAGLWRFVPADYVFADPSSPWDAPTNRWYTNLVAGMTGQDYVAIKLGDVRNSWVSPVPTPQVRLGNGGERKAETGKAESRNLAPQVRLGEGAEAGATAKADISAVRFEAGGQVVQTGEKVAVPVSVSGFHQATTAQFTLGWDPTVLRYAGVGAFGVRGLGEDNFGTAFADSGKLTFSWDDPAGTGLEVADGTALFTVYFDAIGAAGSVSPVAFGDSPTVREATVDLAPRAFASGDGQVIVAGERPVISCAWDAAKGTFRISLPSVTGRHYILESADSLSGADWRAVGAVDGDGSVKALRDPNATTQQRFYRVRVE